MKIILIFALIFWYGNISIFGQISSTNTYYVLPPTNGCNGVWAIQLPTSCSTYALNPCWKFDTLLNMNPVIIGDTLFLALCYLPCDFYATNNGYDCFHATCSLVNPNYIKQQKTDINSIIIQENSQLIIDKNIFDELQILDIQGKIVADFRNLTSNAARLDISFLKNGIYFLCGFKNMELIYTSKIVKND